MKYSILKYGSHIRGDSDKYSDKDLLIVTERYCDIKNFEKLYPTDSWSISYYTYQKLEYLSRNGYLFVKHLIVEGLIVKDDDERLKEILKLYDETINYEVEIKKVEAFFDFLIVLPNNLISYSWLCDNIYVNFRNLLIYKSASDKKYKFSYIELVNNLQCDGLIDDREKEILNGLRVLKSCYRNEISDIIPNFDYIVDLLNIMKKFNIKFNIKFTEDVDICKYYDLNTIKSSYKKLRLLELIYHNVGIKDQLMIKYITNPQMYANSKSINKVAFRLFEDIMLSNFDTHLKFGLKI